MCFSPWGHKESDMTERLNGTERINTFPLKTENEESMFTLTCYFFSNKLCTETTF